MRRTAAVVLCCLLLAISTARGSVTTSKHNLSAGGPGSLRAASEGRICVFCHTPHLASIQAPLWNREDPGGTYIMYWSPTMDAYSSSMGAPQPEGSSKLCLSCHDGTIALGSTLASGTIRMTGGVTSMPASAEGFIGRDLSGDHPVAFTVTEAMINTNNAKGDVRLKSLAEMRNHADVSLDSRDRIQCATCHDPHDDQYGSFLVTPRVGELCIACHD